MFRLRSAVINDTAEAVGPYTTLLTAECTEHPGIRAVVSETALAA